MSDKDLQAIKIEYQQKLQYYVDRICKINPKRVKGPGFLDPSHSRGGGGGADSAPLRSRKPIDETSSVWY